MESEAYEAMSDSDDDDDSNMDGENDEEEKDNSKASCDIEEDISENSIEDSNEDSDQVVHNDKYLIFTTGFKTYTPHQIGNYHITTYQIFSWNVSKFDFT